MRKLFWLANICGLALLLMPMLLSAQAEPADWSAVLQPAQQFLSEGDYNNARPVYEQEAAKGNGLAQFTLGLFYKYGWDVVASPRQSCQWFKLAAQQNVPVAQEQLGLCYLYDHFQSAEQHLAYAWLERAYQAGLTATLCEMGKLHIAGRYARLDETKGLQMCHAAARAGVVDAQLQFAKWLFVGDVVTQDIPGALSWFILAAKNGNAEAAFNVGRFYDAGIGLPQDTSQALNWYELAASRGYVPAYLPAAALSWVLYSKASDSSRAEYLAKAYIWGKAADARSLAGDSSIANITNLMTQISAEMPREWETALNTKVSHHLAKTEPLN